MRRGVLSLIIAISLIFTSLGVVTVVVKQEVNANGVEYGMVLLQHHLRAVVVQRKILI